MSGKNITSLPKVSEKQAKDMAQLNKKQLSEIQEITYRAIAHFEGNAEKLETAIGALYLGIHLGWKTLYIIHNKRTIRQFEEILGITFKEYFDDVLPGSRRSPGYTKAEDQKKYWKVVNGTFQVPLKRMLQK